MIRLIVPIINAITAGLTAVIELVKLLRKQKVDEQTKTQRTETPPKLPENPYL
jgi:hypothetical protein